MDENIVKDLHAILTENIIVGGIYRNEEVRISGADFVAELKEVQFDEYVKLI